MALTFKTPGVHIIEVTPAGPIEAVGTSTAAFIGPALAGPMYKPTKVAGWDPFVNKFGKEIGELHRNGICHGDLRVNNILVKESEDNIIFYFLDNERNAFFSKIPRGLIIKNLVQLNMLQSPHVSRQDRLRFFQAYCQAYEGLDPAKKLALLRGVQQTTAERLAKKATKKWVGQSNT